MTTNELRARAHRARAAADARRAAARALLEAATRRLRRAQELRALTSATLTHGGASASAAEDGGPAERFQAAQRRVEDMVEKVARAVRESVEQLHDAGVLDLGAAPEVRLFVSDRGGIYRVRCTPFEANPAEEDARREMRAIVFETLEGRWVGSVPVHPSCTLEGLGDRALGAFLAFAR